LEATPSIEISQRVGAGQADEQDRNASLKSETSFERLEARNRVLRTGKSASITQNKRRHDGQAADPMYQGFDCNDRPDYEIMQAVISYFRFSKTRSSFNPHA
jgi:hypothetical protein